MRRQAIHFPDSPTKQISVLVFQLSRSARSSCTSSIGLSPVHPSNHLQFVLSHPHRPTYSRHPCHLPENSHKGPTCQPVTPHYNLLHTCYTLSLQCYTPVTPSYTPVIITFWGYLEPRPPLHLVIISSFVLATPSPPLCRRNWQEKLNCKKQY